MAKRKLVFTVIGFFVVVTAIMVYGYFSRTVVDEKKENQQPMNNTQSYQATDKEKENEVINKMEEEKENVTLGSKEYQGFILDNVLHSEEEGDIHYNVYIPDSYAGTKKYALYVTLPGYHKGTRVTYQHGGGYLFCRDKEIMGWLFKH